ncbi:MAG: AAA family ATPase [Candidatus Eisenbacteria bacterium]|uniref:AAA family ATPase n=1 Tax=Eiseniibacteriota bacterium TaxID=2212470 RepID=A0A956SCQ0_UNCEI|nr:AAA family ATPase [Candidatus Eisenbacteria bacterium]
MIKRLYVHNFRCLENFELEFDRSSVLLIGQNGSGKSTIPVKEYLEAVMPDLADIKNTQTSAESSSLEVRFSHGKDNHLQVPFGALSDGEKCFMISALVVAANKVQGPLLCFWDEPDSHLSLSEVGHFVMGLRRTFEDSGGQLILSSHSPEAIRKFSDESTWVLWRRGHLEPTQVRRLEDCDITGDLIDALTRGDVAPGSR